MSPEFLLVGTPGWEVVARVPDLPPRDMGPLGEALPFLQQADEVVEGPGGSAVVTAGLLARLGRSAAVLGAVGDDEAGLAVARFLARRGVGLPVSPRPGRTTKRTAVLIHRLTGQAAFFADVPPGMAPPPTIAELPPGCLHPGTWVHLDHLSPLAEAILRMPRAGASLDLHDPPRRAPSIDRLRRLLPRLSLVQVRRSALEELVPRLEDSLPGPSFPMSLEEMASWLAGRGPLVVVTDGDRGAWWFDPGGASGVIPPSPVPRLVDPTGAGDAFAAALLDGLSRGLAPGEAGAAAAQAASAACTRLGPWGQSPF